MIYSAVILLLWIHMQQLRITAIMEKVAFIRNHSTYLTNSQSLKRKF